jgi:predicted ATP-binding protein involved in virulence
MKRLTEVAWFDAYHKLAVELHRFYKKNGSKAGPALFKLLNNSTIYKRHNSWLSNRHRVATASFEPIQVFVSFSRSRQPEADRTEILNEVWKLLTKKTKQWSKIRYEGCPTPVGIKLQYIRSESVQRRIWQTFDELMRKGTAALTESLWNEVKAWRGIQIPSFTIFLFWIKNDEFLPLDKNTRLYLERGNILVSNANLTFEVYHNLLNDKRLKNYTTLSAEAYYFNNNQDIFEKKFGSGSLFANITRVDTTFRLIGLHTLTRSRKVHKVLKPFRYYPLDYAITPDLSNEKNETVLAKFQAELIEAAPLYNLQDLKVNITAIVGKNGSGKSTILDLVMMGIYNLSIELGYIDRKENPPLKRLNFEIYWHTDTLYKLSFDKEILFYSFQQTSKEDGTKIYELNSDARALEELRTNLFYTILVNYSHYALNSSDYKIDWITPLSHKNDGYITPVVINPKRTQGDIQINNERDLLNMRLLLNLLELHDADIPRQSFRYIDNGKYLKYFSILYDAKKQNEKIELAKERVYDDHRIISLIFDQVTKVFHLDAKNYSNIPFIESVKHYLFNKMLTIVDRYSKYKAGYKNALKFLIDQNVATTVEISEMDLRFSLLSRISDLLEELKKDSSHIVLKFKQVINYLKYSELREFLNDAINKKDLIELDEYKKIIDNIINSEDENLSIAELLPPPIFKLDFHLDDLDKSSFSRASSGEYQLVSVLSSVLYHIRNINSVEQGSKYNYVMVLLDEIELYFHPNMQRFFIKKFLEALSKLDSQLYGIHVLFATHSPFVLSDIQQEKILKLKNGEIIQRENGYNTFAANIHDLLADEFFLDEGYMGALAQKKIENAINLLNYIKADSELKKLREIKRRLSTVQKLIKKKFESEKTLYGKKLESPNFWDDKGEAENWDIKSIRNDLRGLIRIIGEPLIKDKLSTMYQDTFNENIEIETQNGSAKETILRMMRENNITNQDLE